MTTPGISTLAAYVQARREALGLGVTGLADRSGLTKSEISAIERGRISLPGADKRRKLAQALGVSHLDLLIAAGEITDDEVESVGEAGVVQSPASPATARINELVQTINWDAFPDIADGITRTLNGLVQVQQARRKATVK